MRAYPRFLQLLSALAISGYLLSPFSAVMPAYGAKTKPSSQKTTKTASSSTHHKSNNKEEDTDDNSQDDGDANEDNKNPTQSLFDAINTGSLQGARDALDRGADLHAANVLGQTPLEMSIDLNRDRITFLLLSMRGYNNSPQSLSASGKREMQAVSIQENKRGHLSFKGQNQKNTILNHGTRNLYPHDNGGVPKPEIGFLGFQRS